MDGDGDGDGDGAVERVTAKILEHRSKTRYEVGVGEGEVLPKALTNQTSPFLAMALYRKYYDTI